MSVQLTASTVCFHYAPSGQRCRMKCLDPVALCCATHLQEYEQTPTQQLLDAAATSIIECTRFSQEGLPFLACTNLSSWHTLCNALHALSFQGYHNDAELLTLLVSSIESINGPWQGSSAATRPGKSFERLVTRLYLEELAPLIGPNPGLNQDSVRVSWDERLRSLPGGLRQVDVLLRWRLGGEERLTVIECRDKEVEVSEVDAFVTLVRHLAASNGVLVSSRGFQKGAEDCARFEGIEARVVTEEDFSPRASQRVVEPVYAFEALGVHLELPEGRGMVSVLAPPQAIHVVRNGVIGGTLADILDGMLRDGAPRLGSMPPSIDIATPGTRLLLPDGRSLELAAIHMPVRIVETKRMRVLPLPERPLSFLVKKPVQGVSRKVDAANVPLFAAPVFEKTRFYVNLMGQTYYCETVFSAAKAARLVLLNDQQHDTGPIDVEFIVESDQAGYYHPVEDPRALDRLLADLARFRSFATTGAGA